MLRRAPLTLDPLLEDVVRAEHARDHRVRVLVHNEDLPSRADGPQRLEVA
jgi:hypothetical protein